MGSNKVFRLLYLLLIIKFGSTRSLLERNGTDSFKADTDALPVQLANGTTIYVKPESVTHKVVASNVPTNEMIKNMALIQGMDPVAVAELLESRQPVIKQNTDEQGHVHTTTYKLEPDGAISSHTVTEIKPFAISSNENFPKSRDPVETESVSHLSSSPHWEWTSLPRAGVVQQPSTKRTTITRTWQSDPKQHFSHSLSSSNFDSPMEKWPEFNDLFERRNTPEEKNIPVHLPDSWSPSTWNKPVTSYNSFHTSHSPELSQTPKPKSIFDDVDFKRSFDTKPDINTSGTVTNTVVDSDGRKTTTTVSVGPTKWTTNTFRYPVFSWADTTETSTQTLPSLADFLKSQYETTTKLSVINTENSTRPNNKPAESIDPKPVKRIILEELPITEILQNGKPVDESFLQTLPTELRPISMGGPTPRTLQFENIPQSEVVESNVKSFSKTVHTGTIPTAADLDSNMREILAKAGISPDEIKSTDGDTITKTRQEPGGKVITTTYRVRTIPSTTNIGTNRDPFRDIKPVSPVSAEPTTSSHTVTTSHISKNLPAWDYHSPSLHQSFDPFKNTEHAFIPKKDLISEFLAQFGLTKNDVLAKNGQLDKIIVNDDGQVLTASLVLSTPKGNGTTGDKIEKLQPIK